MRLILAKMSLIILVINIYFEKQTTNRVNDKIKAKFFTLYWAVRLTNYDDKFSNLQLDACQWY